jgi:hypothetical protein
LYCRFAYSWEHSQVLCLAPPLSANEYIVVS